MCAVLAKSYKTKCLKAKQAFSFRNADFRQFRFCNLEFPAPESPSGLIYLCWLQWQRQGIREHFVLTNASSEQQLYASAAMR